jgi:hypothetical protein
VDPRLKAFSRVPAKSYWLNLLGNQFARIIANLTHFQAEFVEFARIREIRGFFISTAESGLAGPRPAVGKENGPGGPFSGANCRTRTGDLLITNQLLYQLS